jgi:hypothetical protein
MFPQATLQCHKMWTHQHKVILVGTTNEKIVITFFCQCVKELEMILSTISIVANTEVLSDIFASLNEELDKLDELVDSTLRQRANFS